MKIYMVSLFHRATINKPQFLQNAVVQIDSLRFFHNCQPLPFCLNCTG